jgi:predicted dehydrogenase
MAGVAAGQMKTVGIGFLGASHSHAEAKLDVALATPQLRVVGVYDRNPAVQALVRKRGVPLLEREELLRHPDVEAIAVESAVRDHGKDGIAVLEHDKHLHLEKAPADNLHDLQRILKLAADRHRVVQMGYMWRYNPAVVKAVQAGREGWLGSIYLVRGTIGNQLAPKRRPDWAEFPGGTMFELGGHIVDPLVRLMGRPRKVTAYLRTDGNFNDTLKDNTAALFEWEKAMGIVQSMTLQPDSGRYRTIEIFGTNGAAVVNPIEPPVLTIDLEKAAGPYASGVQKLAMPPYKRFVEDFVHLAACICGEQRMPVSAEEELSVQETLLRASGMYSER